MITAPHPRRRELGESERRVLESYTGGRTEREALDDSKKGSRKRDAEGRPAPFPAERQHQSIRKKLEAEGLLLRMTREPGSRADKWIPKENIVGYDQAVSDAVQDNAGKRQGARPSHGASDGESITARAWEANLVRDMEQMVADIDLIVREIDKPDAWRKRGQINRICTKMIGPLVNALFEFSNGLGYEITLPPTFFGDERPRRMYRSAFGLRDYHGPLAVAIIDPDTQMLSHWFPALPDWYEYLQFVRDELVDVISEYHRGPRSNKDDVERLYKSLSNVMGR